MPTLVWKYDSSFVRRVAAALHHYGIGFHILPAFPAAAAGWRPERR